MRAALEDLFQITLAGTRVHVTLTGGCTSPRRGACGGMALLDPPDIRLSMLVYLNEQHPAHGHGARGVHGQPRGNASGGAVDVNVGAPVTSTGLPVVSAGDFAVLNSDDAAYVVRVLPAQGGNLVAFAQASNSWHMQGRHRR